MRALWILPVVLAADGGWRDRAKAVPRETVAEEVARRRKCVSRDGDPRQVDCTYFLGSDAVLSLAEVGSPDAAFVVVKSDFNGDAYVRFAPSFGCAMLTQIRAPPEFAFVSPKTGKVYSEWPDCAKAR